MDLEIINNLIKDAKNSKFVQGFIEELANYVENTIEGKSKNNKEEFDVEDTILNGEKITSEYRDKMNLEKNNILNQYAEKTQDEGQMFYIYSKNSKMDNGYNLCVCEQGKSHNIVELSQDELPQNAEVGSVIRYKDNEYILDEAATIDIKNELKQLESNILKEQSRYLDSKRINEHIYEISEKDEDRVWLFDNTEESSEAFEEIDFPKNLLDSVNEGDKVVYRDGSYQSL